MFGYTAPIRDMRFVMREIVDIEGLSQLPGCDAATPDTVDAILEEAGKLPYLKPISHEIHTRRVQICRHLPPSNF